jgi:F-type H+-transporting ATPase subunit a
MTQVYGIQALGAGSYFSKFLNLKGGFIGIFVGLLEAIGEVARVLSFSFRLFGNIFAGEVLLATMAFLIPWVAAVPFMGLELFVGLIQALIFAMLTLVFMTMATMSHEGHEGHAGAHH